MKKKLYLISLIVLLFACEQRFEPVPTSSIGQTPLATDNTAGNFTSKSSSRIFPAGGIQAMASGGAAVSIKEATREDLKSVKKL